MKKTLSVLLLAGLIGISGCSISTKPSAVPSHKKHCSPGIRTFRYQVEEKINVPHLDPGFIGIYIEDPETREIIYSYNAHKLLMPASNMKLFTTSTGMALLGPEYKYVTEFYTDGKVENGVLNGNLYIKGSGDPSMCPRHYEKDMLAVFNTWVNELKKAGITQINGSVIGDDNVFEEQGLGYGWSWDDLSYYYSAPINGLQFNDNCMDVFLIHGENPGDPVKIFTKPEIEFMEFENELETVHPDSAKSVDFYRYPGTETVKIFGTLPAGKDTTTEWITVENPTLYLLKTFEKCLADSGITVKDIQDIDNLDVEKLDYESMAKVFEFESVSFPEIIEELNKSSNNLYAETVQKTLGKEFKNCGSTKAGIEVEKNWFSGIGINPDGIFIKDGSGLSRHNMVTTYQVATVLRTMKYHKNFEPFFNSLPVMGGDGTTKRRLKGSNAAGHVFAKTGYVGHVRALSGYVHALNGKEYIFSIIVNHYPVPTSMINNLQDEILTLLYNIED